MAEQRKLATIMGIDVAGYSRAAEIDDTTAAEAIQRVRAAVDEVVAPNNGRVFSTAGDGFMIEFPAAASGVAAARALLTLVRERALSRVRIGLHLGDVIVQANGDLLGHGVNVAARLMQMSEPNTAVVSQAVRAQLRQTADVEFKPLGRVQLDKMSERLEVFALAAPGVHFARIGRRQRRLPILIGAGAAIVAATFVIAFFGWRALAPAATPRLAVLRFDNLGDAQPYFAEGVADEFISEVSQVEGIDVIARASSFALTGPRATPADAARALGATLVLAGSVRRSGDAIRVNAVLAEAPSGRQIWDQTFEGPLGDADKLERDVAVQVARAVGVRALDARPRRIDPRAYDLYLRGLDAWTNRRNEDAAEARDLFRAATTRDPEFAKAWAWLGQAEAYVSWREATPEKEAELLSYADRAIVLDPSLSLPYERREIILTVLGRWSEAEIASRNAIRHGGASFALYQRTGQNRAMLAAWRQLAAANPLDADTFATLAIGCNFVSDWSCAQEAAKRALELEPGGARPAYSLFMTQVRSGDRAGARRTLVTYRDALRGFLSDSFDTPGYLASLLGDAPHLSIAQLEGDLAHDRSSLANVIGVLAESGYTREAASLLPRWGTLTDRVQEDLFFQPSLEGVRRTPEFWTVMQREGLVRYWRESHHWPDFCESEPVCTQHLR